MSPNLTAILRSLKGAPLSCLLALSAARGPVTAKWLCEATGYSPGTVTAALRALRAHDFVTHNRKRSAWQLTRRGEIISLNPRLDPFAASTPEADSPPAAQEDPRTDRKVYDQEAKLKDSDSSLKAQTDSESGSSLSSSADLERIFQACQVIFGEPVHAPRGIQIEVGTALACIAQAYCQRGKLGKPARVVFANLRSEARPGQKYLDEPLRYLPDEFLHAAGLERPSVGDIYRQAYAALAPRQDLECTLERPEPVVHASLQAAMHSGGTVSALRAWESLLAGLRGEVAYGVYRGYLEPLELIAWDAGARRLRVEAPDEASRAFVMDNLCTRIQRYLQGFSGGEVRLEILVDQASAADELDQPGLASLPTYSPAGE